MKYLFVVNSNITALCAKAVIKHEQLPHNDVIILSMRGAVIKGSELTHVDFIYPHITNPIPQTRNILKAWKVLAEFDRFIEKITSGGEFYCYVNHNMARNTELMVNHSRCKGFSILEEGASAYNTQEYALKKYLRKRSAIWDKIGYKNRIGKRYFYRPDYDKVYAVTPGAFLDFRDRVQLHNVFSTADQTYENLNGSNIIVFDAIATHGMINLEELINGIKEFIYKVFSQCQHEVYYKFHPAQPENEREIIKDLLNEFNAGIFVELPDHVILEELAASAKNITFYFNASAVAIYANYFGHKCYSFSKILGRHSINYDLYFNGLNLYLKNSLIQI